MNGFLELTSTEGLAPGTMREVDHEGHHLLVTRVGDEYFVTDARCPHLGGRLAKSTLEGTVITCHLHHSQFDVRDGSCLRWTSFKGAALTLAELTKHPRALRAYESKVENGIVFVGAEKPAGSTPAREAERP